ncbi:MAG: DUF262 domain-containing protein, partial [Rhodospirillaceae bacterium]|nr:DUF262 domain-containing protein [Rhodospirillaceae bacterium]
MEPYSDSIEDLFSMIRRGEIKLPRFQRHEAWNRNQIVSLLENVLRKPPLPIGAMLTLNIDGEEPFHSRFIVGAPQPNQKIPKRHLLDGQQRLTALWRCLTGSYNMKVFVSLDADKSAQGGEEHDIEVDAPQVEGVKRWDRKGVLQPVWVDSPHEAYERKLLPATVLQPGAEGERLCNEWLNVLHISAEDRLDLYKRISKLRERVAHY